ncbi:chitinase [Jatrophihabitans sp.]|uniref:chitinase n=1 Tax=Jatrophihabitans sp. TaxID=1932789 RepID=UPI0030C74A10|nr:Chitinase [Jatrophihabitans sp.]
MSPEELAHAAALGHLPAEPPAQRHLSWRRVIALCVAVLVVAGAVAAVARHTSEAGTEAKSASSFLPYVDVTATPQLAFEDSGTTKAAEVALGFIVGSSSGGCTPSWGNAYSVAEAGASLDLDRRIARLRQLGGDVVVSFGGAANSELAVSCSDVDQLADAYGSVVQRYDLTSIDLDIEGAAASAEAIDVRRALAIRTLQLRRAAQGDPLGVWLTLPVAPTGLTSSGIASVQAMLQAGVALTGVNALTMDYGQELGAGQTMADLAVHSLTALHTQLISQYHEHGVSLSDQAAWQHVGATAMIGQNDTVNERFELTDAKALVAFARLHQLRRISMWSLNRDQSCGPNYANPEVVSDLCSGVSQTSAAFATLFAPFSVSGTGGSSPTEGGTTIGTSPEPSPSGSSSTPLAAGGDDPKTSPYSIWNPDVPYPAETKVVWHRNVYQAKWYSEGDTPDAPVATQGDTPWTLIGPVLPGEHPAPTPTFSAGAYPDWSPTKAYASGQRILFHGVGFQARWWTKGDTPGALTVATGAPSPWQLITPPTR